MDNTKKENLKVLLEVTGKNYNEKGALIDAISASAKLSKADAGRLSQNDEDTITILASDCGTPTLEANYNSKSLGKGETATSLELDLKGQTLDLTKNELIDAIAAGSKLTKADAGRELDKATEDWHKLKALKNCDSKCASLESYYTTKTTQLNK